MKHSLIPLILFLSLTFNKAHGQRMIQGSYVGLEAMSVMEPDKPSHKWYHLTQISIIADSAFVYQSPIYIVNHDTTWSASDGAFYDYKGKITLSGNQIVFDLHMTNCDYCALPTDSARREKRKHKVMTGQVTDKGFIIKNQLFRKVDKEKH